jgi:hypothetical protein
LGLCILNEKIIENNNCIRKIKDFLDNDYNLNILFNIKTNNNHNKLLLTKVVCFLALYIDHVFDIDNIRYKACFDFIVNDLLLGNLEKNEGLAFVVI